MNSFASRTSLNRIRLPVLIWGIAVFVFALRPLVDFDTFWQLQTARYMWQTETFIYTDVFSQAPEVFRLEHCWLSDLIFYALFSLGGYPLLSLLKPVVITACALLLSCWNRLRGVEAAVALPVITFCLLASAPSWLVRPQLWTFLLCLLYLHLLHRGRADGGRSWLWLPPLMVLWANLHAACVFGLVLIGLFGAGELARIVKKESDPLSFGKLAAVGLLSLAAAFANPYGYRIPALLLGNLALHDVQLPTMLGNMEWLPPTFAQVPLFYVVMALWGGLILVRLRRIDPAEGIFFLAFLYMGMSQIRHTTLVSLLAGYYLPGAVQSLLPAGGTGKWVGGAGRWGTIAALAGLIVADGVKGNLGVGMKQTEFPTGAVDYLKDKRLPANLYNAYDWGGYLMWRLYPDYLVFVDGRQDSQEHFQAAVEIDTAGPGWEEKLRHYGINTVITRTCYFDTGGPLPLVEALVRSPEWALVYRDEVAVVFLRREERFRPLWEARQLPSRLAYETMHSEASRLFAEDRFRTRALLSLGRSALNLGRYPESLDYYRRHLRRFPGDREAALMIERMERLGP